jgi:hypothetical protein
MKHFEITMLLKVAPLVAIKRLIWRGVQVGLVSFKKRNVTTISTYTWRLNYTLWQASTALAEVTAGCFFFGYFLFLF